MSRRANSLPPGGERPWRRMNVQKVVDNILGRGAAADAAPERRGRRAAPRGVGRDITAEGNVAGRKPGGYLALKDQVVIGGYSRPTDEQRWAVDGGCRVDVRETCHGDRFRAKQKASALAFHRTVVNQNLPLDGERRALSRPPTKKLNPARSHEESCLWPNPHANTLPKSAQPYRLGPRAVAHRNISDETWPDVEYGPPFRIPKRGKARIGDSSSGAATAAGVHCFDDHHHLANQGSPTGVRRGFCWEAGAPEAKPARRGVSAGWKPEDSRAMLYHHQQAAGGKPQKQEKLPQKPVRPAARMVPKVYDATIVERPHNTGRVLVGDVAPASTSTRRCAYRATDRAVSILTWQ
ncbi:hypothetical protein DIPPA_03298 [Diplonema papillatum]|nr:hypothetical protein DIPPA_03298 [Diplonema papillatum]